MSGKLTARRFLAVAVVPVVGLLGCFGSDAGGGGAGAAGTGTQAGTSGLDGIPTEAVELPGCEDGEPDLLEGFTLGQEVDYIADRWGSEILSQQGTPCMDANDAALCQGKLDAADGFFRNLLTTERDEVRIWEGDSAVGLFGGIDTVAEAAWLAASLDYRVPCTAKVARVFDLFVFDGVEARFGCLDAQAIVTVSVSPEGQVNELRFRQIEGAFCEIDPLVNMGFAGTGAPPPIPF